MSTTFSANLKLGTPAANDPSWNTALDRNRGIIDALSPIGGLAVTMHESPSASLTVDVAAGTFVDQSGAVQSYAGTTSYAIAASTTKVLYLDGAASWALTTGAGYPATPHVRLATVVAGATTLTSVTDNRQSVRVAGQSIPSVTHLLSAATSAPAIAAGSAAGTSPTVSLSGTDVAGVISITTGTSPGTGILATATFNVAFGSAPRAILLAPANSAAAGVAADVYADASGVSTTVFTVNAATALLSSTTYKWSYLVVG